MRLVVEAEQGELASDPGAALDALAKAAELDGAGPDWLEKALRHRGVRHIHQDVDGAPRHRIAGELADQVDEVYRRAMASCASAVRERLLQAARDANPDDVK